MPSWEDAAGRYDEEQAAARAARQGHLGAEERAHAANLAAVAEADGLVQDFLRAARSAGNPGAWQPGLTVGWLFKRWEPSGVPRWVYDHGHKIVVQADGLWKFHASDYTGVDQTTWSLEMGRRAEGLYYEQWARYFGKRPVADFVEHLQRGLVVLVRKHGIPTPG